MPKLTRAHFESAPQLRPQSWGHLRVPEVAAAIRNYVTSCSMASPEQEAVCFYALNQMVAVFRKKFTINEPLSDLAVEVYSEYQRVLVSQARRQMSYLVLITSREARHLKYKDDFWKKVAGKYGACQAPLQHWMGSLPDSADGAVEKFKTKAPNARFDNFATALMDNFNMGSYSGGYGGKPWGNIAKCLRAFVVGDFSAEIMVDTAYTLAHNNGPMYNKGMLYSMYGSNLIRILDIQRSGMICEAISSDEKACAQYSDIPLKGLVKNVMAEYPEDFGEGVDWKKVVALGAVGDYGKEITEKPITSVLFDGKKAKVVGKYNTGFGDLYPIIDREKAA